MFYFMCFITFICVFNLLVMAFITWKFGIYMYFNHKKSFNVFLQRREKMGGNLNANSSSQEK